MQDHERIEALLVAGRVRDAVRTHARTAGEDFTAGSRVSIGRDGLVHVDPDGAYVAYGAGSRDYAVTIGPPLAPSEDPPTQIIRDGIVVS